MEQRSNSSSARRAPAMSAALAALIAGAAALGAAGCRNDTGTAGNNSMGAISPTPSPTSSVPRMGASPMSRPTAGAMPKGTR